MQFVGLAYWAMALIELIAVLVGWNTSLLRSDQFPAIFGLNFFSGICGFAIFFILTAYAGQPHPGDRLLFNKEPFPRASAMLAAVCALVAIAVVVSTVKIGLASHGWSPETPTANCADRVSRVIQTSHDKWMHYKCVSHHEWLQIDKASSLMMAAGSTFMPMVFGTLLLGVSISRALRSATSKEI